MNEILIMLSSIKRLLIDSVNPEGDDCTIVFPDVKIQHMEVVLKFLYTGKTLPITTDSNIIKELLEKVLHIDAKVRKLQPSETIPLQK